MRVVTLASSASILCAALACACEGSLDGALDGPPAAAAAADAGGAPSGSPAPSGSGSGPSASDAGRASADAARGDASSPPAGDAGSDAPADDGAPLVQAPLTGNVTQGTWEYDDLPFQGIATGKFHYAYLLPDGYSVAHRYPILVYEHENTEGNSWYQSGGDPTQNTIVNQDVIDGVFNSVEFRTKYPCIVVVPFCDQTDGSGGSSGQNFGGYNDVPGQNVNENAVVGVVKHVLSAFSAYPKKVYITGDSLGGIGSEAAMLDYNAVNGPIDKVFTAGLPYAAQIAMRNPDPAQDQATIARMASVPVWAVSGSNDTTSPPDRYNRPMWQALAGNGNYPSASAATTTRAGSSQYHYTEDPGLGHDVWSQNGGKQYRLLPDGAPMYDWLFSQTSP